MGKILIKDSNMKYLIESEFDTIIKNELIRRKKIKRKVTYYDIYEDLSDLTGLRTTTIQNYRHKSNPFYQTMFILADYFKIELSDIWKVVLNDDYVDDRGICSISVCDKSLFSKEYCYKHYMDKKRESKTPEMIM